MPNCIKDMIHTQVFFGNSSDQETISGNVPTQQSIQFNNIICNRINNNTT